MVPKRLALVAAAIGVTALPCSSGAQAGWGAPYVGPLHMGPLPPGYDYAPSYGARGPREGKIDTATFLASNGNVGQLGHGSIVLAANTGNTAGGQYDGAFESALIDQLGKAGYRTDVQPSGGAQTIEFIVSHDIVQPPEPRHSPIGGGVAVGAGSRGWGGVGVGIDIDLSKPLKALVATRLQARIRDSSTNELLWEGRAQVVTRDGDKRWTPQSIATRMTAALFKGFPKPS
jgi:hypothetical protein